MNWHLRTEEEPQNLQKIIVKDDNGSIGYGVWHNGKFGFGLANVIKFDGNSPNLYGFTKWISLEEMKNVE